MLQLQSKDHKTRNFDIEPAPEQPNTFSDTVNNNVLSINDARRGSSFLRHQTFFQNKEKLIDNKPFREMSAEAQIEIRHRADAYIDSIKTRKAKDQRMHIVLLFASPLVIKYQDEMSDNKW